jgi:hypothetical protein
VTIAEQEPVDVLMVCLGSTAGLRSVDEELAGSLRRAGASVALATSLHPGRVRTLALTDLRWARAARTAAQAELCRVRPTAVIYSTVTAALLWPRAGAVRFDAPASGNRPGRHGIWQRPLERRRLGQAPLLLPQSDGALAESPVSARTGDRALIVPVPVEPSADTSPGARPGRDIAAITYAANPLKKGLDRILAAWQRVRRPEEELVVAGVSEGELERAGIATGEGVRVSGLLSAADYRALVRRSRVFLSAPRREDYGIAQLEALADGCVLVTTPAPGPYVALPIARTLDGRLVGEDLPAAIRVALDDPAADYASRAGEALAPFRRVAVDRLVAEELLPRLLG